MTGQRIRLLPRDHEAVAPIEAHRRLVLHEHPGMQLALLQLGLLQQGMADPASLPVGAHEQRRQEILHQRHEAEQLTALLVYPDAGMIEVTGS
ncbi:hypothetical protein D3C80_1943800 [compost metagenome]